MPRARKFSLNIPSNQTPADDRYYAELEVFFSGSLGTTVDKLDTFAGFVGAHEKDVSSDDEMLARPGEKLTVLGTLGIGNLKIECFPYKPQISFAALDLLSRESGQLKTIFLQPKGRKTCVRIGEILDREILF